MRGIRPTTGSSANQLIVTLPFHSRANPELPMDCDLGQAQPKARRCHRAKKC